jgi:ABC-type multidrug transport system ATPase subunit
LLARLGLRGKENAFANEISLGQSKRVAVARALAANSSVMFLDEPLAGLDARGIEETVLALKRLVAENGATLVIVEHSFNHHHLNGLVDLHWELQDGHLHSRLAAVGSDEAYQTNLSSSRFCDSPALLALTVGSSVKSRAWLDRGAQLTHLQMTELQALKRPDDAPTSFVLELRDVVVRRAARVVLGMAADGSVPGLSVRVEKGQILVLEAPNGWGKSSLLAVIAGSLPVDSGQVIFNGEDITHWPVWKRARAGISVLTTGLPGFSTLTVGEIFRLAEYAELPTIVRALANRRFDSLSGGEKQRVRLSAMRPGRLLLLDEPFNALDADMTAAIDIPARLAGYAAGIVLLPTAAPIAPAS